MADPANEGVVLYAKGDMRIASLPYPTAGPNDVIVAMRAVGICGSDVHYFCEGSIGPFVVKVGRRAAATGERVAPSAPPQ